MENAQLAMRDDPALADEDVIRRIGAGETLLFEVIMRRYNQRLFRVARAILKNDGEAEDVIQETYLRAYSNLQQFAGEAKFSTWLTRITVHECLARIRRNRLLMVGDHPHLEDRMAQIESRSNPEEELTQRQLGYVLESVIDTLPAKYRIVFALRELQELSTEETAHCLQISEEAVKSRLFRARSLLRKKIDSRIGSGIRRLYQFDGERCDRIVAAVLKRIS
jgi:RNA polymerase sigma-70 factor (ECF subfamily)